MAEVARRLNIVHFNDVYNVENTDRAPFSGAARVAGLIKGLADSHNPLVLFSGDAFSPSCMSTITLGSQMPPILNAIGVAAACVGNHDLDNGLPNCLSLIKKCSFPWLMSNVLDKETGRVLPGLHESVVIEHAGLKVGLVGLVEGEWLQTLAALDPELLTYRDFVAEGTRLARQLKAQGADVVVALTHMRVPNDRRLAASVPEIDLVLGGHDHDYEVAPIEPHGTLMVKSGTDFRDVTLIELRLPGPEHARVAATTTRFPVSADTLSHEPTLKIVEEYAALMGSKLDTVVGHAAAALDARFSVIRRQESNMGNLLADVLRAATATDLAIINSGSLRSDQVHPAGPFRLRDLVALLPMPDMAVVIEATGAQVLAALENGVSQVPRLEGRFPQVSGLRFAFDPRQPAGQRVRPGSVAVAKGGPGGGPETWGPLQLDGLYRVCTKAYMAAGKDGYDVLKACKVVVDEEDGVVLASTLRNHFRSLAVLNILDPKVKASEAAKLWSRRAFRGSHKALAAPKHGAQPAPSGEQLARKGAGDDDDSSDSSDSGEERAARRLRTMPTRARLVAGETGPCVLTPDMGYAVKPVLEDRIVDLSLVEPVAA